MTMNEEETHRKEIIEINQGEVHIWIKKLTSATTKDESLLNDQELKRAHRFRFPVHKIRFIAARSFLRTILSFYINKDPSRIEFYYGEHGKPEIREKDLQFNLSHSHDIAIYAIGLNYPVGIDIEKIKSLNWQALSKRFFSKEEFELLQHAKDKKIENFYKIWSRKEALIKAVGKGLSIPLKSFSVSLKTLDKVVLNQQTWQIIPIKIQDEYECAVACDKTIHHILFWELRENEPKILDRFIIRSIT